MALPARDQKRAGDYCHLFPELEGRKTIRNEDHNNQLKSSVLRVFHDDTGSHVTRPSGPLSLLSAGHEIVGEDGELADEAGTITIAAGPLRSDVSAILRH